MQSNQIKKNDHYQGSQKAPVLLVEYGDFQCSYCSAAYWQVKKLQKYFKEDLCFVFRHFPLRQVHPAAFPAALAAEAAGKQGQFWNIHDTLFEKQHYLESGLEGILLLAQKAGLDIENLQLDMTRDELVQKVEDDFETGIREGVNGTPSFFINGYRYNGILRLEEMIETIQQVY